MFALPPACRSTRVLSAVPAAMPLSYQGGLEPSETVSPTKCFLLSAALAMVFRHSDWKVAKLYRKENSEFLGLEKWFRWFHPQNPCQKLDKLACASNPVLER